MIASAAALALLLGQGTPAGPGGPSATPPAPETPAPSTDAAAVEPSQVPTASPTHGTDAQLRHAQDEISALRTQLDQVSKDLADTKNLLANEQSRSLALEQQIAAGVQANANAEAARQSAEAQRSQDTTAAAAGLQQVQDALGTGNTSGVDAALAAQADALSRAGAISAARWVAAAREALARGDLAQARIALGRAQAQTPGDTQQPQAPPVNAGGY